MKKAPLIDPYELCLCGSGKKYKFCCYSKTDRKFHNANESYIFVEKNKKKLEFCLHKDCSCSSKIIKSHSIQNNKILSKLAVKGHVYCIDYNANSFAGADLKKCGKNDATTATCFCLHHDTEIFKNIELINYKYTDEQNFLYAYRAFSKAYYDKLEEQATQRCLFENCHQQCINSGFLDRIRGTVLGIQDNEVIKDIFNTAVDKQDYSVVETMTATLDYEIKFATSYTCPPTYDLMGNQINDIWSLKDTMKNIFVNIFPENGKTYILISWLKVDAHDFKQFKEQFEKLREHKELLLNTLNNMVACQSDNLAISPELVESWSDETKNFFLNEFVSFLIGNEQFKNIGQEIEKKLVEFPCKFNLFAS